MSKNMKLLLIGGAGLAVGTAMSLAFPDAGELPGTALMLILCISAALCGASVPGVIQLNSKAIRATGAAVFFALPWLIEPASVGGEADAPPEHTASAATSGSATEAPPPPPPATPGTAGGARPTGGTVRPRPGGRPRTGTGTAGTACGDATKAPSRATFARPRTILDGIFSTAPSQK